MIFIDNEHEKFFHEIDNHMHSHDCYYRPVAYLIALDTVCREHIEDIFDFNDSCILPDCLNKGWQTGTSMKTIRLAFNLWNGYCTDGDTFINKYGYEDELPSSHYTPDSLFCSEYAPYYFEAVKLRHSRFFTE